MSLRACFDGCIQVNDAKKLPSVILAKAGIQLRPQQSSRISRLRENDGNCVAMPVGAALRDSAAQATRQVDAETGRIEVIATGDLPDLPDPGEALPICPTLAKLLLRPSIINYKL